MLTSTSYIPVSYTHLIPDIASDPFGAFILNSENAASVANNNPNPDITAILLPPLSFCSSCSRKMRTKKDTDKQSTPILLFISVLEPESFLMFYFNYHS